MPRTHAPGQRSQVLVADADTGELTLVHESADVLLEAPNWTPDGRWLLVNGDGHLFRLAADGGEPERLDVDGLPPVNNDHVLSPDGRTVYASADDGHVHAVPLTDDALAAGPARRVTDDRGPGFRHFLHGVSPDGQELALIGMRVGDDGSVTTNVHVAPVAGGPGRQLTDDAFPDDGAEHSPDGAWVYFNSERGSTAPGHAQLFRMRPDGSDVQQLTRDERVNWFPHLSPDGARMAYVSFPPGTLGHPADRDVVVRTAEPDGSRPRDLAAVFGGQGTVNVPSWAPDSRRLALVAYPVDQPTDQPTDQPVRA